MADAGSYAIRRLHGLFSRWEALLASPDWYLTVVPQLEAFHQVTKGEPASIRQSCRALVYDFFETHLTRGDVALARDGTNADADRKKIDTVVIHHTSNPPGLRPEQLSAIELIRLYAPYFAHPTHQADWHLRGEPIGSGHLRSGKQVFWPYHWIVRKDGRAERLLYDSEIGWHAGNWDINCRSVAIVLDNDYEESLPSRTELLVVASIVRRHYSGVPVGRILGHQEVNTRTVCPSKLFLDTPGHRGWKSELLDLIALRSERAA